MTAASRSLPTPLSPLMRTVEWLAAISCACSSRVADLGSTAIQTGSGFDLAGSGCTLARSYFFFFAVASLRGAAFLRAAGLRGELARFFAADAAGFALPT